MEGEFHTFRGYSLNDARQEDSLSPSMEDYLEMIYRLSRSDGFTRVLAIASALHVQPPAASRAMHRLAEGGFVQYERYSIIRLTEQGEALGAHLLKRHNTLERFLGLLDVDDPLEDVERIEHNISARALMGIESLISFFSQCHDCKDLWQEHRRRDCPPVRTGEC
jgi:Mn-dependent DtxR family transcriptional regulator